jgi:uncharacterized phiE125 gp8 family phage protein
MMDIARNVRVVTAPTYEPVTLAEAKLWLRIDEDDTDQDAMVMLLIRAMTERAEQITGRAFVKRTLELRMDEFPGFEIELPGAPLLSVSSIQYVTADGIQTLDASPTWWQEDNIREPGVVAPPEGDSWPNTADVLNAVRITYRVGYSSPNLIPKSVRLWMQAMIGTYYENREQVVTGTIFSSLARPFTDGLLDGLKVNKNFA